MKKQKEAQEKAEELLRELGEKAGAKTDWERLGRQKHFEKSLHLPSGWRTRRQLRVDVSCVPLRQVATAEELVEQLTASAEQLCPEKAPPSLPVRRGAGRNDGLATRTPASGGGLWAG